MIALKIALDVQMMCIYDFKSPPLGVSSAES